MYFDYLAIGFLLWGLADSLFGADTDDDTSDDQPDDVWLPTMQLLDEDEDADADQGGDSDEDADPEAGEGDADETDPLPYVSGPTTVIVEPDGEEPTTNIFEDVDFGVAPTVSGSDARDTIDVTDTTGFELNIDAGAGDDVVNFGFGASVDGGEGADILTLSVTPNALASDSDAGTLDLSDAADALTINFADETPEFVHTVRGSTTETIDGIEVRTDWIDYYVSNSQTLNQDDVSNTGLYDTADATRVFRAVLGENPSNAEVSTVNEDPTVIINREIASEITL